MSEREQELVKLLREWLGGTPGECCGCGQWLGTKLGGIKSSADGNACLHCRTRVALAKEDANGRKL